MDQRAKDLIKQADYLFTRKLPLNSLHQEIADNFYPQRADFTATRSLGEEFATNLVTSYPILAHRELANSFSAMLRPSAKEWFEMSVAREDRIDQAGKIWLERKTKVMKRAMYDREACFIRATKEGDADFAAFGQCAISTELSFDRTTLLYRCWHLRDMAWCENYAGKIDTIVRRWKPTVRELCQNRALNVDAKVKRKYEKDPYQQVNCLHVVIPAEDYDLSGKGKSKTPFISIYVDMDNQHTMSEEGVYTSIYCIPRWQTVSGSQYAYSPSTVAALPDGRLLQAMTLVLLEAGEKAVNPPNVAVEDAVRSDISIFAGGTIWIDPDYDERTGEAFRSLPIDTSGIPLGIELRNDVKHTIMEAFYLNKLSMPPIEGSREMTAYEAAQRVQDYIRNALPLFEPMEMDYNGKLCEDTFEIMMRTGAFGSVHDMPESLRGQTVQFKFESPLHDAAEKAKGHTFLEARAMIATAMEMDQTAGTVMNVKKALRDALEGNKTPDEWLYSEEESNKIAQEQAARTQQAEALAIAERGGAAAADAGAAAKSFAEAQQT